MADPNSRKTGRILLPMFGLAIFAACLGPLASEPAAAKKRPADPPRETPVYKQCPDGTTVEENAFCPFPPPPVPPPPPMVMQPPPPGEWRSNWGAVAVDSESGIVASVTGFARISAAETAALDDCRARGGRACVFAHSYKDACVSMVQGDRSYFFETAPDVDRAARKGLDQCRVGQTGCHIRLSTCAPPTFVPY